MTCVLSILAFPIVLNVIYRFRGHVTVVDSCQFNFTVLPTRNYNYPSHMTCFINLSFSNCFKCNLPIV